MGSHEKREGNLSCQICAKSLPTKKFLERHMKIHARKETCPTCGKIVNKASFEEHVKSHLLEKEKPNKCPQCMFSCYKQSVLEKHMILHSISNDTLYTCETCHYLTTDVTNMKKHRRIHLNIKTMSCNKNWFSIYFLMEEFSNITTGSGTLGTNSLWLRIIKISQPVLWKSK